jgi:hypothetical protein
MSTPPPFKGTYTSSVKFNVPVARLQVQVNRMPRRLPDSIHSLNDPPPLLY